MRFYAPVAFALISSGQLAHALRGSQERRLKNTKSEECTVVVAELLAIEPDSITETVYGKAPSFRSIRPIYCLLTESSLYYNVDRHMI